MLTVMQTAGSAPFFFPWLRDDFRSRSATAMACSSLRPGQMATNSSPQATEEIPGRSWSRTRAAKLLNWLSPSS